jgi:hypothetical protein
VRYAANTIEDMQELLIGYRDNMRVEIETGVALTAKTVADLGVLEMWPDGLALNIHIDLDLRLSVVRVERVSRPVCESAADAIADRRRPPWSDETRWLIGANGCGTRANGLISPPA